MANKFTKQQQQAIDAKGTVLVTAAAGSGKTTVLVERIVSRFCDEKAPLMADRALIVTFTNAAAEELKSRIESELNKRLLENPQSDLLKRQNMVFKHAMVCTIDSFCISVVRENFNALNISRDFKISDSTNLAADYNALLDSFILDKFENINQDFIKVTNALQSGFDDRYIKDVIMTIYNKSRSMPYPQKWLDEIIEMYKNKSNNFIDSDWANFIFDNIINKAEQGMVINQKLKEYCIADNLINEKHLPIIEYRLDYLHNILVAYKEKNWDSVYEIASKSDIPTLRRDCTKDPTVYKLVNQSIDNINAVSKEVNDNFYTNLDNISNAIIKFTSILECVINLVKEFDKMVFEKSKSNNTYTFDQIEHLALELFSVKDSAALKNFNSMYDAILVDEYQDTSNLQDTLFEILGKAKNELFMVGDVKQSIYAFRNANPDNFLIKKNKYPLYDDTVKQSNCKILLSGNFRSRKGICNFINYMFYALMTKADADMDYDSGEALDPQADFVDNFKEQDVEIKLINQNCFTSTEECEANYTANYILKTMDEPPFIDDGNGNLRKAKFSDFVLLFRSLKKVNTFIQTFKNKGIPLNSPSDNFKDSVEIITSVALLKIIDNINDSISLMVLLKSPVFNFNDEEIAKIMLNNRHATLYSNLLQVTEETNNDKFKKAVEFLNQIKLYSSLMPLDKLLSKVFADTYFIEIFSSMEGGTLRKANLRVFVELASNFSNESGRGIKDFIAHIENDTQNSLGVNITGTDNAVQITSIHKAKGLQYPICIICDTQKEINVLDTQKRILCDDNFGTAFSFYDSNYDSTLKPISSRFISKTIYAKIFKEELRLLYVAMTRAKERLVLMCVKPNVEKFLEASTNKAINASINGLPFVQGTLLSAKSYADWIFTTLLCHKDGVAFRRSAEDFPCVNFDCSFKIEVVNEFDEMYLSDETHNKTKEYDYSNIKDVFSFIYPEDNLNSVPAKTSVTNLLRKDISPEIAFKARPAFLTQAGLTAAEIGTATHKFMEYCNFEAAENNIDDEIERLYEWQFISEKEAEAINKDSVAAFFQSYAYNLILKANNIHKEYRFITQIPAHELNSEISESSNMFSLVQGVADCIIENDNDLIIIDYKTDSSKDENYYIKEYEQQLKMYSKALSTIFKKPVSKCILYSFSMKKCIEVKTQ